MENSVGPDYMGESSKFPEAWTLEIQILKLAGCLHNEYFKPKWLCLDNLKTIQRRY